MYLRLITCVGEGINEDLGLNYRWSSSLAQVNKYKDFVGRCLLRLKLAAQAGEGLTLTSGPVSFPGFLDSTLHLGSI